MALEATPRNFLRPARPLLVAVALLAALATVQACLALLPGDSSQWRDVLGQILAGTLIGLGLVLALDLSLTLGRRPPQIQRELSDILPVGHWQAANLLINNESPKTLRLLLKDHTPEQVEIEASATTISIPPFTQFRYPYRIRPVQRGKLRLGPVQMMLRSPLGWWEHSYHAPSFQEVKVYPDFANVQHFSLLLQDNLQGQSGVKLLHRRGEGQDFHQLREYRRGDSLRQLDWKATARVHKLISREYQDERDQTIFFLLDCGRRMRTKDGELSHFDHALNAMLLLSLVALRQGDSVGLLAFGGKPCYLAPVKSISNMNSLLNAVYDLHSTTQASDYQAAALEFMQRVKKRSLVIYLTNIRNENVEEVSAAVALLKKNHIVMVANLQESILEQTAARQPENFQQALTWLELHDYLNKQANNDAKLKTQSVNNVRTTPSKLPVALINSYWEIKRAGKL